MNGHPGVVPPWQGGSSISSLEPATNCMRLVGFCAMDGSFCLFCGNGSGCSRLAWLFENLRVAAWAGLTPASRPTQTAMVIAKGLQIALIAQPPHP